MHDIAAIAAAEADTIDGISYYLGIAMMGNPFTVRIPDVRVTCVIVLKRYVDTIQKCWCGRLVTRWHWRWHARHGAVVM